MEQPQPPEAGKRESKELWLAVFLIAGMLLCIGVVGVVYSGMGGGESSTQTPTGAFHSWTQLSKDVYAIRFGALDREIRFEECRIRIIPSAGNGSVEEINFTLNSGTFSQPATNTSPGIEITEYNVDGKISAGDLVTVTTRSSGFAAVDNGNWTIHLIFIMTSGTICYGTFTVSGNP
jgi:hypothetical protein